MFKFHAPGQDYLLPPSLKELIPPGDLVEVIEEIVPLLDIAPLTKKYHRLGQHAYYPGMLLSVLFYAYSQGVFSSRKIAERLCFDVRFMYLSGRQRPDFRTISDFRKDNLDLLKTYFVAIVRLCQELGMVPLQHLAIDSTKIKASASPKRQKDRPGLQHQLAELDTRIAQLLQYAQSTDEEEDQAPDTPVGKQLTDSRQRRQQLLDAKAKLDADPHQQQVNLTDPDCRVQKEQGPGYNCQLAVDSHSQVIVAAEVVPNPNDTAQLLPLIAQAEANTRSRGHPKQVSADAGYATTAAYKGLADQPHLDAYVPPQGQDRQRGRPTPPYDKYHFRFDPVGGRCTCPQGHPMTLRGKRNQAGITRFDFRGISCPNCPVKIHCTPSRFREVCVTEADRLVSSMRAKLATPAGYRAMTFRKCTAEPVMGHLKEHLGFRRFRLLGLPKVAGEFALVCTAHNLKKLHQYLGGSRLTEMLAAIRAGTGKWVVSVIFWLRFRVVFIPNFAR